MSGGPQLSWLAEEGYGEYVIPTNPSRRSRALELYEQAGRALGIGQNAAGGFVGGGPHASELASYAKENAPILNFIAQNEENGSNGNNDVSGQGAFESASAYPAGNSDNGSAAQSRPNIEINVQMNPEFAISGSEGQSEETIVSALRRHVREMADELGGEIARQIEDVFSNMPLEGA